MRIFRACLQVVLMVAMVSGYAVTAEAASVDLRLFSPCISNPGHLICETGKTLKLTSGESFSIEWIVENWGEASSHAEIRHYVSSDSTISTSDQLIGTEFISVGSDFWLGYYPLFKAQWVGHATHQFR